MLSGKRADVSPQDVVPAVMKLYTDSLYIFCVVCYLCEQP